MELKLFKNISNSQFAGHIRWLSGKVVKELKTRTQEAAGFAVGRVYETGDVTAVNKLLTAMAGLDLTPKAKRCIIPFVPFKYDAEAGICHGKIQTGKRAALEELNADGIPKWEAEMFARFEGEKPENKEPPAFKLETRLPNLLKKAVENGYTAADIRKLFNAEMKKVGEHVKPAVVQEVKKGRQEETKESRKAA
jgi:hypothetical protein